jgi:hypothetical protein
VVIVVATGVDVVVSGLGWARSTPGWCRPQEPKLNNAKAARTSITCVRRRGRVERSSPSIQLRSSSLGDIDPIVE